MYSLKNFTIFALCLLASRAFASPLHERELLSENGNGVFGAPIPAVPSQTDSADPETTSVLPFGTIKTTTSGNITRATISNGPLNIMDWNMIQDLKTFTDSMKNQTHTKVVILQSSNPSFFIAQLSLIKKPGS